MSLNENGDDQLFPYEIRCLDPEDNSHVKAHFPGDRRSEEFIQVGPQKWCLLRTYEKQANNYYNFQFREDDVVVATFPRSGTTLTQEMVWLLCNDLNYEKASEQLLNDRFPFLEFDMLFPTYQDKQADATDPGAHTKSQNTKRYPNWKQLAESTDKRFIKTHLPFPLLSPSLTKVGCKIIYVARNPKDVAVSHFHLQRLFSTSEREDDVGKFWDLFTQNLSLWCPYFEHIKEGWKKKDDENVLFMFYEDMIKDMPGTLKKVASFLEIACTTEQLEILANHLSIDNFRKNKSLNRQHKTDSQVNKDESFIRKGKAGGWKDHFDAEWEKRANEWIDKNLKDTDIKFPL